MEYKLSRNDLKIHDPKGVESKGLERELHDASDTVLVTFGNFTLWRKRSFLPVADNTNEAERPNTFQFQAFLLLDL